MLYLKNKLFKVNVFVFIIVLLLLSGCAASFSKKEFNNEIDTLENLHSLSGTYNYYPIKEYSRFKKKSLKNINAYDLINNKFSDSKKVSLNPLDKIEIKKNNSSQLLEIIVLDENTITVRHLIDKKILVENTINGELKGDGFFYLDNKYKKTNGIPYLWGGKTTSRGRIGLTHNNNLILNNVTSSGGAILFILANGNTSNTAYEIERL